MIPTHLVNLPKSQVPHIEELSSGRKSISGARESMTGGRISAGANDELVQKLTQKLEFREESIQELKAEAVKSEKVCRKHSTILKSVMSKSILSICSIVW